MHEKITGKAAWPHAPPHHFETKGTYFVTAATYQHRRFFDNRTKIRRLHNSLLDLADEYDWRLQAWAAFANHYHFVASSPRDEDHARSLRPFLSRLHTQTAAELNKADDQIGRKIWFNFWDTRLTYQKSWLARLKYVKHNAVQHGLVRRAADYPWCSAAWFEGHASPAFASSVDRFKIDRLNIYDDFD